MALDAPEALLTPRQVRLLFGVCPKTLINWHNAGKIDAQRTAGGHRRYPESGVRALLATLQARAAA